MPSQRTLDRFEEEREAAKVASGVKRCADCKYPEQCCSTLPPSEWSPTIGQPTSANSDVRQALLDGRMSINQARVMSDKYTTLRTILDAAFSHAATGKGKERHARDLPFDEQPMMTTTRLVGKGFPLGQAIKKAGEAAGMIERGELEAAELECLGAINYLAGAVAWMHEQRGTGYIPPKENAA